MYGFLLVFYSNFEIFDFKNSVTLKTVLGSVKVMELLPFDREHMTSYERSITTMGLSYRFRDRRRFRSKIAKKNFPPLVFCAPAKAGSNWNWVLAHGLKK